MGMTQQSSSASIPTRQLENVDPLTSAAFHAFGEMLRLHRQVMLRMLAQKGYHHGEAICLPLLVGNDGIAQRDLADILHVSRPQVTKIVQALEQNGVVVRRNDADDQRLTRVYVTREGRRRELEMRSFWEEYLAQTIGSLSPTDRAELERLLRLLSSRVALLLEEDEQDS